MVRVGGVSGLQAVGECMAKRGMTLRGRDIVMGSTSTRLFTTPPRFPPSLRLVRDSYA